MTQRLVLIKPDVKYPVKQQGFGGGDVGIPTGLISLAAFARQNNDVDVKVIDRRLEHVLGRMRNPENDFRDADIVGAGACTSEVPDAYEDLRLAKSLGKKTLMGGMFASSNPEEVLRTGLVDFVVRGEGEKPLSQLLQHLEGRLPLEKVRGVSFMADGKPVHLPDGEFLENLDFLPMPAYDLLPMADYARFSSGHIYAARGCAKSCKFCTPAEHWGFSRRQHSIERIIETVALLRNFGFDRINFKDESIANDEQWAIDIFSEIRNSRLGGTYKAKARVGQINDRLMDSMINGGLQVIHTGAETPNQRSLNAMRKGTSASQIEEAVNLVLSKGASINPVYIIGWPGETPEELEKSVEFIERVGKRKGVITYISFITPHPGSRIGSPSEEGLRVLTRDYDRYNHKQPVAVPYSLGKDGVRLMVNAYHRIAEETGMQEANPSVDPYYMGQLLKIASPCKLEVTPA